jgi:hypothetical protein
MPRSAELEVKGTFRTVAMVLHYALEVTSRVVAGIKEQSHRNPCMS